MAKLSSTNKNNRRRKLIERARELREKLKEIIRIDPERRDEAVIKLNKRKRDENPIRLRRRCRQCSRPKGTYRKFGLCRICLRQAVMRGDVPGVKKASW